MDRRKFIKNTCAFCVGASSIGAVLTSCSVQKNIYKTIAQNNIISIPLSEFIDKNHLIVRATTLNYDIFTYKINENNYTALLMKCTHRDSPVQYSSGGLVCNEHGSRFGFDGVVTKAPATESLKQLEVSTNETHINIKIT